MNIVTLLEPNPETRVAITPSSVKHLIQLGFNVLCEHNAYLSAGFNDAAYTQAGAILSNNRKKILSQANVLVAVNEPSPKMLKGLPPHALLIAPIDNTTRTPFLDWCNQHLISVFSMNHIPRITRAQSLDSLSSQASLAGYRAVIEAVAHFKRAIPMMMTAAGMIQPAKVLILGAGVAGLQAIATAKRLGAIVYAFDVRHASKEQVESLGAEFIEVDDAEDAETQTGYAKEVSENYRRLQAELIDQYAIRSDIIITTALIPNQKAPLLLSAKTIEHMQTGSVIVDLATSRGGNCEGSVHDKIITIGAVTIIGYGQMAGLIPATASDMYANNIVNVLRLLTTTSPTTLHFNAQDEIIQQATLCHEGHLSPFQIKSEEAHHA